MERFDVLDRLGKPTGRIREKGSALAPGEYYLGVHGYLYDEKLNFLIQRRAFDKAFRAGEWDIHLGHVMAGESSAAAMNRELFEEVGVRANLEPKDCVARVRWDAEHHFADIYLKRMPFGRVDLQMEEVIGVKLISLKEMEEMVKVMFAYRPEDYVAAVMAALDALGK